jgi:asparagine synthase (glutamine-hydrolysing)
MCGIAGFVGQVDRETLARMTSRLAHRGPDGEGLWIDPVLGIHLGHRRLAVIDPVAGHQPLWNEDGTVGTVFNGEIYNHAELRRELEAAGHHFATGHCDTEVLVHGYEEWGCDLPNRLNGMFAFTIVDRVRRRMLLARDRFGEKPLYIAHRPGLFAFASELPALISHTGIAVHWDTLALQKFFAYGFIPAPATPYAGVEKLPPGYLLEYDLDSGQASRRCYYRFSIEPDPPPGGEDEWAEQLDVLLGRAVAARLESDVPLGLLLSGGIDSSLMLSYAADSRRAEELKTFSMGFREASYDESVYARMVAAHVGSSHHEEICDLERAKGFVHELGTVWGEPVNDASIIPTSLVCRFVRNSVTVALSGDGGDELFAGYDPFAILRKAELYHKLMPRPVHQALTLLAARLPVSARNMSLDFKLRRGLRGLSYPPAYWSPVWLGPVGPDELADIFSSPVDMEEVYSEAITIWEQSAGKSLVDRTMEFYTRLYLAEDILAKTDRASMSVSLELRAPFLDVQLTDYVRRLPSHVKLRGNQRKYLLRKVAARRLPEQILTRPKKGFGIPLQTWLREMQPPANVGTSLPVNEAYLRGMWDDHREARRDHRGALWSWLTLSAVAAETQAIQGAEVPV